MNWRDRQPHPTAVLWWARPFFSPRLSSNILREVHYYLQGPFLAVIHSQQLAVFDVGTRTWKVCNLDMGMNIYRSESYLMISSREVFIAGQSHYHYERNRRVYILNMSGSVRRLRNMLVRGGPGLYYSQENCSVLAFGGGFNYYQQQLRCVQTYSFLKDHWEMLPYKMNYPRAFFTPSEYHGSLYLVGGHSTQIESFSLKTHDFTVIWTEDYPYVIMGVTVPRGHSLFIISSGSCDIYFFPWRKIIMRRIMPHTTICGYAVMKETMFTVDYPPFYTTIRLMSWDMRQHKAAVVTN